MSISTDNKKLDIRWDNTLAVALTGFITYHIDYALAWVLYSLFVFLMVFELEEFGIICDDLYFSTQTELFMLVSGLLMYVGFDSISTFLGLQHERIVESNSVAESILQLVMGSNIETLTLADYFLFHAVLISLLIGIGYVLHRIQPRYRQFLVFEIFWIGCFLAINNSLVLLSV